MGQRQPQRRPKDDDLRHEKTTQHRRPQIIEKNSVLPCDHRTSHHSQSRIEQRQEVPQ